MSRLSRLAPAVLAALALSVFAAAPAYAASPGANPTLTITATSVSQLPLLDFAGGCPAGSDAVSIETPTGSFIAPTLDGADDFSATGYAAANWGGVGDTLSFVVTCSTAGVDSPTTTESITLPDYGASVTIPATVPLDQPITATGTCGLAPGSQDVIFGFYYSGGAALSTDRLTEDGGPFVATALSTPAELGVAVGSVLQANAFCVTPVLGGGESYFAVPKSNTFVVVAPLVPVDHATLTATIVDPTNESSDIDFAGECGPTADHAELQYDEPTDTSSYYETLVGGSFTDSIEADHFGEPGDVVDFTTHCFNGTTEVGVSAPPVTLTLPDTGSALTMAASFTTAQRLNLSGTCGTSGATQVLILFGTFSEGPIDGVVRPISGATYSFTDMPTPAELGAVSDGVAQVLCFRAGDVDELDPVSARFAEFTVTLPAKSLPATGTDATAPLTLGALLLGAGALLLLVRRVRVR